MLLRSTGFGWVWAGFVVNLQANIKILPHQMPSLPPHPGHLLPSLGVQALPLVPLLGAAPPAGLVWSPMNRAASPDQRWREWAESSDAVLAHLLPSLRTCRPPRGQAGGGGSPWSRPPAACPEFRQGWAGPAAATHAVSQTLRGITDTAEIRQEHVKM